MKDPIDNSVPSTEPTATDGDLDAVLNRARNSVIESRKKPSKKVQEVEEEDEESDEVALSEDEPEDSTEVAEDEEPEDELDSLISEFEKPKRTSSQESEETQSDDEESEDEGDDDLDLSRLSRRKRGKLIQQLQQKLAKTETDLRAKLENEQRERQRLEQEKRRRDAEEANLRKDIEKVLGTEEEYRRLEELALSDNADDLTKQKYRIWRNNRKFYGKIKSQARNEVRDQFVEVWFGTVKTLPGVDPNAVKGALHQSIQHIYAAGFVRGEMGKQAEIDKLKKRLEALESRSKSTQRRSVATTVRTPVVGGRVIGGSKKAQTLSEFLFDEDGLPSDRSEQAIKSGQFKFRE